MVTRYLSCASSQIAQMSSRELLASLEGSEGRIIVAETIGVTQPMLGDVTNAEFAASMGADLLILNLFDVQNPHIEGLPEHKPEDTIRCVKKLTGRAVGINLEPAAVDQQVDVAAGGPWSLTSGRTASVANARKAIEMGADFIVLTANPGVGADNNAIERTLRTYRAEFGDDIILIAGKMHAAGIISEQGEHIITRDDVTRFAQAGADIILLPAPGTVPGITLEYVRSLVEQAHTLGKLTLTAIGTSQEGADTSTIQQIALMCKMTGTDLHHLGDSGYVGMATPENILAYSKAIRGVRHTYHRMASSILR